MLNSVSLMGRFVKSPELHKTNAGKSVTSFTLANDKKKDTEPNYIECVAWDSTAEHICRYCEKGQLVAVNGALQTRVFDNRNGERRKSTELVVNDVTFCGKKETKAEAKNNPLDIETSYLLDEEDIPY